VEDNLKYVSIEQQLDLVKKLRNYELYIADIEFSAPIKTPGMMEGLDNVRRAADFIESLAKGAMAGATEIGTRWAAREALFKDNDETED